jgi:hypothetical protein
MRSKTDSFSLKKEKENEEKIFLIFLYVEIVPLITALSTAAPERFYRLRSLHPPVVQEPGFL